MDSLTASDWVQTALTAALIAITAYYAYQNYKMAREMTLTRKAQFLPHLKLAVDVVAPQALLPRIRNVGPGPALDGKIILKLSASEGEDLPPQVMERCFELLMPTDSIGFHPKGELQGPEAWYHKWPVVECSISYMDILGERVMQATEQLNFLEYWENRIESSTLWERGDMQKIHGTLEKLYKSVDKLSKGGYRPTP